VLGPAGGPAAAAGIASPAVISVDCDRTNGVSAATITGEIGDTFTIDNTAASTGACTFALITGVVSATNLSGSALAAGQSSVLTILGPGSFNVTPQGGSAVTMTVVIGVPVAVPEYTISFDANGGTCNAGAASVTGVATDWYVMPSGADCQRRNYQLMGWATSPGATSAAFGPGAPGQFAEDETLYAVWQPEGVEITFDANVGVDQPCLNSAGRPIPIDEQTTTISWGIDEGFQLPTNAPCTPLGHSLVGWAKSGNGPVLFGPGEFNGTLGLAAGTSITLYAIWRPDFAELLADRPDQIPGPVPCTPQQVTVPVELTVRPFNELADIDFASAVGVEDDLRVREVRADISVVCSGASGDFAPRVEVSVDWALASQVEVGPLTAANPGGVWGSVGSNPTTNLSVRAYAVFDPASPISGQEPDLQRAPESVSLDIEGRILVPVGPMGDAVFLVSGTVNQSVT
jgi:hypothetical protein